jgi:hypothetical protein
MAVLEHQRRINGVDLGSSAQKPRLEHYLATINHLYIKLVSSRFDD